MQEKLVSILVSAAVASLVIFTFGFVAFNVVPPPSWFHQPFPVGNPAIEGLGELETGMYVYPFPESEQDMDAVMAQMKTGPIFTLHINSGTEFNLGLSMIEELLRAFLAAILVSFLLSIAYGNLCCYAHRVFFVSLCGLFAATTSEPTYSIWYWRPCGSTTWMFGATVVGWTLAGFAIAALVKPWVKPTDHHQINIQKSGSSASNLEQKS